MELQGQRVICREEIIRNRIGDGINNKNISIRTGTSPTLPEDVLVAFKTLIHGRSLSINLAATVRSKHLHYIMSLKQRYLFNTPIETP